MPWLLERGTNPNLGDGCMLRAARTLREAKHLVEAGAWIGMAPADAEFPAFPALLSSINFDREDLAKYYLRPEFNLDPNYPEWDSPPLFAALARGSAQIIALLLRDPGLNLNVRDKDGKTALMTTHSPSNMEVLLAAPRLDVLAQDNEGDTALHHATRSGHYVLDKFLQALVKTGRLSSSLFLVRNGQGKKALNLALDRHMDQSEALLREYELLAQEHSG